MHSRSQVPLACPRVRPKKYHGSMDQSGFCQCRDKVAGMRYRRYQTPLLPTSLFVRGSAVRLAFRDLLRDVPFFGAVSTAACGDGLLVACSLNFCCHQQAKKVEYGIGIRITSVGYSGDMPLLFSSSRDNVSVTWHIPNGTMSPLGRYFKIRTFPRSFTLRNSLSRTLYAV